MCVCVCVCVCMRVRVCQNLTYLVVSNDLTFKGGRVFFSVRLSNCSHVFENCSTGRLGINLPLFHPL